MEWMAAMNAEARRRAKAAAMRRKRAWRKKHAEALGWRFWKEGRWTWRGELVRGGEEFRVGPAGSEAAVVRAALGLAEEE